MKLLVLLSILMGLFVGDANAQNSQCNQIDQIAQTRCQLERAIMTNNLSLIKTIFEKSTLADVNDREACSKHTYAQCVAATGNLDVLEILFDHGLDPNLIYAPDYPILMLLLEGHGSISEEYGVRLIDLFP